MWGIGCTPLTGYTPSSKEARAGAQGKSLKQKPQMNAAHGLTSGSGSATFLTEPRPRDGTAHSGRGPATLIGNQELAPQT